MLLCHVRAWGCRARCWRRLLGGCLSSICGTMASLSLTASRLRRVSRSSVYLLYRHEDTNTDAAQPPRLRKTQAGIKCRVRIGDSCRAPRMSRCISQQTLRDSRARLGLLLLLQRVPAITKCRLRPFTNGKHRRVAKWKHPINPKAAPANAAAARLRPLPPPPVSVSLAPPLPPLLHLLLLLLLLVLRPMQTEQKQRGTNAVEIEEEQEEQEHEQDQEDAEEEEEEELHALCRLRKKGWQNPARGSVGTSR